MAEDNVVNAGDSFAVKRLAAKPVVYTVQISHVVIDGRWMMGVQVHNVASDEVNRSRIANDLRQAADMLEDPTYQTEMIFVG